MALDAFQQQSDGVTSDLQHVSAQFKACLRTPATRNANIETVGPKRRHGTTNQG